MRRAIALGIFVGGGSRRMGGRPKGLLPAPGGSEPIVARLVRIAREAGLEPVLIGNANAYRSIVPDVPVLVDQPAGIGPLGGLAALLEHAQDGFAIALACDAPHVTLAILERLAQQQSTAQVLAPRMLDRDQFEPFLARYDAPNVRPIVQAALARGVRSFHQLFETLMVEPFVLAPDEESAIRDWDTPDDVE